MHVDEWVHGESSPHLCNVPKGHAYGLAQEPLSEELHLAHGADSMLLDERFLKALKVAPMMYEGGGGLLEGRLRIDLVQ